MIKEKTKDGIGIEGYGGCVLPSRFSLRKEYNNQNRDFYRKRKHCRLNPTFKYQTNTQLYLNPDSLPEKL